MAFRYFSGGNTLDLRGDRCGRCGRCVEVCPHGVLELAHRKALVVARERCMECGACARNCAVGAIAVVPGVGCAFALIKGRVAGGPASCDSAPRGTGCC